MKLFEPGRIGNLEIKNRIVMLPMGTRLAGKNGHVTDRLIKYYEERARGGAGLIIVEITSVDYPRGNAIHNSLAIDSDDSIPGLKQLSDSIKRYGAKSAIQISHAGNAARPEITGQMPVAPSAIKRDKLYQLPRELSLQEVKQLIRYYAQAAGRAKKAGFDGVEIHGAHLYLVSQFLSRAWNKRQDEFGGDLTNRVRFLKEILSVTRDFVGPDYPVWCRINGEEQGLKEGTELSDAKQTARMLEDYIDALSVSAIGTGTHIYTGTSPDIPGVLLPLAKAVKDVVNLPIIGAGRITPEIAESALEEKTVDFIGLGRSLLSDPFLPKKLEEGNRNAIRPCITCLKCYTDAEPITCSVNAFLGNEKELKIEKSKNPKKCIVAGGGPAGMTAAVRLAEMGHKVTLYEKEQQLGGQLTAASVPPGKKDMIEPLTLYLKHETERSDCEIKPGVELTAALLDKENPDILVNATGVKSFIPDIPGISGSNVMTALEVLEGTEVGEKIAVIGGELVGCETADYLAQKGKNVVIMRRGPKMATNIHPGRRRHLLNHLVKHKVTILVGISYEKIVDKGIIITDREGETRLVEADTIVIAAGYVPNVEFLETVRKHRPDMKVINIGDSLNPRSIKEAIDEGYRVSELIH